jgi:hypothetical protein
LITCREGIVRATILTALVFLLCGWLLATSASQLARRDVGTPVFGGMILASFIGIFAISPLYVVYQAIREGLRPGARPKQSVELVKKLADTDAATHEEKAPAE